MNGIFCDKEGTVFSGHLVKGENPIYTVAHGQNEPKMIDLLKK